jgi:hypothetical protein
MLEVLSRDNNYRIQKNAVMHHNQNKEIMMAACDIFNIQEKDILELHKDWDGIQITSTRIDYKNKTITHYADSTVRKPVVIKLKSIPYCNPTYLDKLLSSTDGLAYVKALMNKKYISKSEIISEFERATGKKAEQIRFWTPSQTWRKVNPITAVYLFFSDSDFSVVGYYWIDYCSGLSRGVRSVQKPRVSAKKESFKEGYNQAIQEAIKKLECMEK